MIAYATAKKYFNNWFITFCPSFSDPVYRLPLDFVIRRIREEHAGPMWMDWWQNRPASQSATFFHETMHMSQPVTSPQVVDKTYGARYWAH